MTDYTDITLELADGKRVYIPRDLQLLRLAPAVVCQIGQRIKALRAMLDEMVADGAISTSTYKKFHLITAPLPLEDRLMSGKIVELHDAMIELCSDHA